MSAAPKVALSPSAARAGRVAGEQPSGPGTLPAVEPRRVSPTWRAAEVSQCGELLDALLREGTKVEVRDGALIITGEPRNWFGRCALATLADREEAIAKALTLAFERGPAFAELLAARRAAAGERRRARKPRARRAKKILSVPAVAAARLQGGGKAAAIDSLGSPPPSAPTFTQEPSP